MQKIIQIKNLDCAACAAELQEELEKIEGISSASVDFVNQRVSLSYADGETYRKAVYAISHFEEVEIIGENAPRKKERKLKELISIILSAALFIPALVLQILGGFPEWLLFGLFLASALAAGWSVVWSAVKNVGRAFRGGFHLGVLLDENLLMLVAAAGAFAIGEYTEGAAVMLLYQIGEYLQALAVGSSRGEITKLMELKTDTAVLLEGDSQKEIPSESLQAGDCILLRKGDRIPADCVLCEGESAFDTKSLTGEAFLKEAGEGDELLAGYVNEGSAVKAKVLRPSSESAAAKILNLVENSTAKKAKPEKFITKFSRYYTPAVVLLAVAVAVVPPLVFGGTAEPFSKWIYRALNLLVISCPCALIISVPLTYFSGVGTLARYGVLTKGAIYLDVLEKTKTVAFDKTGTLTEGKFSVAKVNGEERTLFLAAAAEKNSSHPLSKAFEEVNTPFTALHTKEISGMGLSASVEGKEVLVGSARLMKEYGIGFRETRSSAVVVYVAENGVCIGSIEIEDKIKPEAKAALTELKKCGIGKIAVLTGDTKERAAETLRGLPVDEIYAELLPGQKIERAESLKKEGVLLYVGDGINDAPVMAASDLAASMGSLGSDAAIEASDLVLAGDNLSALPKALKGAKKTKKIVTENIVGSLAVKIILMIFSVIGVLPLWLAIFGDVGVMLLAVLNSMRMRGKIK